MLSNRQINISIVEKIKTEPRFSLIKKTGVIIGD